MMKRSCVMDIDGCRAPSRLDLADGGVDLRGVSDIAAHSKEAVGA